MNLKLTRSAFDVDGIFGVLTDENNSTVAVTLEHAYDSGNGDGSYVPKVSPGVYICLKHPPNRLPYTTYELQRVPSFQRIPVSGILLHVGNYNHDSDGCILVGRRVAANPDKLGENMITSSQNTFNKLMDLQKGLGSFILEIV